MKSFRLVEVAVSERDDELDAQITPAMMKSGILAYMVWVNLCTSNAHEHAEHIVADVYIAMEKARRAASPKQQDDPRAVESESYVRLVD